MSSSLYTTNGMLRVRYWPLAALAMFMAGYVLLNMFTLLAVVTGSTGLTPDPFWHAPLFWLQSLSQ